MRDRSGFLTFYKPIEKISTGKKCKYVNCRLRVNFMLCSHQPLPIIPQILSNKNYQLNLKLGS